MWSVRAGTECLVLEPEVYVTWKREKASQAVPGELRRVPILAENSAVATVYPALPWGRVLLPFEKATNLCFYG